MSNLQITYDTGSYFGGSGYNQYFKFFSAITYNGYPVCNPNNAGGMLDGLNVTNNTTNVQTFLNYQLQGPEQGWPYDMNFTTVTQVGGNYVFTYNYRDPAIPTSPVTIAAVSHTFIQNGDNFTVSTQIQNLSSNYTINGYQIYLCGFNFETGSPTYTGQYGGYTKNLFPDICFIDFTNNSVAPNAGVCAIFCSDLGLDDFKGFSQGYNGIAVDTGGFIDDDGDGSHLVEYQNAPILAGNSHTVNFQFRFGVAGSTIQSLCSDFIAAVAAAYPSFLNWSDRRPITDVFLDGWPSTLSQMYAHLYGLNQDGTSILATPSINITFNGTNYTVPSPYASAPYLGQGNQTANFEIFRNTVMDYAISAVAQNTDLNAQGTIVWDIETSTVGDTPTPYALTVAGGGTLVLDNNPNFINFSTRTTWSIGDYVVHYGSGFFVCIQANTNVDTSNSSYWYQLSVNYNPFTQIPEMVTAYSMWSAGTESAPNLFGLRNTYVGDPSQTITIMPVYGYISPNPSTFQAWNSNTAYSVGTYVTYQSGNYVCFAANTGQAPTNTTYWYQITLPYTGETLMKEFFNTWLNANQRVGCTLRPSTYVFNGGFLPDQNLINMPTNVYTGGDLPTPYQTLFEKVNYCQATYGMTLFYVDSIIGINTCHPSYWWELCRRLSANGILLMPEGFDYVTAGWNRCCIPYQEIDEGVSGTGIFARLVYGNLTGTIIEVNNPGNDGLNIVTNLNNTRGLLQASVNAGDLLMCAPGVPNDQNSPQYWVNNIYQNIPSPTVGLAKDIVTTPVTNGVSISTLGTYSVSNVEHESELTYTWSATNAIFSANGTNAAKNTVATFTASGTYTINLTITSPTSSISTSVSATVSTSNLVVRYNTGLYWGNYFFCQNAFMFSNMTYNGTQILSNPGNIAYSSDSYIPTLQFFNNGVALYTDESGWIANGKTYDWNTAEIFDSNGNALSTSIGGNGYGGPQGEIYTGNPTFTWLYYDPTTQSSAYEANVSGTPIASMSMNFVQTFDSVANQDVLTINFSIVNNSNYTIGSYSFPMFNFAGNTNGTLNWSGQTYTFGQPSAIALNGLTFTGGAFVFNPSPTCGVIYTTTYTNPSFNMQNREGFSLAPHSTDSFNVQMRFSSTTTDLTKLAGPAPNYYDNWRAAYPTLLNWPDRRIMSQAYMSSWGQNNNVFLMYYVLSGLTINGTYNTDQSVQTGLGLSPVPPGTVLTYFEQFRSGMIGTCTGNCQDAVAMNAQGIITWDLEGENPAWQEFYNPSSYPNGYGLPFTMPLPMGPNVLWNNGNNIFASNQYDSKDPYVGDLSVAYQTTPALGYVSPNPSGFSAWNANAAYSTGTYVSTVNQNYICLNPVSANSGIALTDTNHWFPIVAYSGDTILQEYFNVIYSFGLRAGITIRYGNYLWNNGVNPHHSFYGIGDSPSSFPAQYSVYNGTGSIPLVVQTLIDKITYAKTFGVSVFYFDSANDLTTGCDPSWFEIVAKAHPEVLICPEQCTNATFRCAMPYRELRGGYTSFSEEVKYTYPNSGALVEIAGGNGFSLNPDSPVGTVASVTAGVVNGNILMTQGAGFDQNVVNIYTGLAPSLTLPYQITINTISNISYTMNVLAAYNVSDVDHESQVIYTWTASPPTVIFSKNGTNVSKTTNITFGVSGDYVITVTASAGGLNTSGSFLFSGIVVGSSTTTSTPLVSISVLNSLLKSIGAVSTGSVVASSGVASGCFQVGDYCIANTTIGIAIVPSITIGNKFYNQLT